MGFCGGALEKGFTALSTLTVSEWADEYRILPKTGSSESGKWRTDRTPYLREIMDELSASSPTREIVFAKGSQIGASEAGTNWIMYMIDQQPGPIMALQPTESDAQKWSKQRLGPSLLQCEKLEGKLSRNNGNTLLQKDFINGTLVLSGSNSASSLSSMPIGAVYFDEVDRYPGSAGDDGDPIALAITRTSTFPNAKIYYSSTPVLMGDSRIWEIFLNSDRRYYHIPCPHCGEYQAIEFGSLIWDKGEPDSAALVCLHCGVLIEESYKRTMLAAGKWIPSNPGHWRVGFHLSSLYSPLGWKSWASIAREFEEAEGRSDAMKVFTNTKLGLPYEESGESLSAEYLERRQEDYNAEVPQGVLLLTLSVDTQNERLEYEVCGWGVDEESWGIQYGAFYGDVEQQLSRDPSNPSVWEQIDMVRRTVFYREDGRPMRIAITLVDSGGNHTDAVYAYTKARERQRVFSIKGGSVADRPLLSKASRNNKANAALFTLGVTKGKHLVYSRLKQEKPGGGFCHFPKDSNAGYTPEYYAGMISEKLVKKRVNGRTVLLWEKPSHSANEPFDLRVYNTAAIRLLNPKWEVLANIPRPVRPEPEPKEKPASGSVLPPAPRAPGTAVRDSRQQRRKP